MNSHLTKPRFLDVAAFLALLLLGVFQGYRFSCGDLDTYLPFILHEHDPSLFRNDLLLGTLGSHPVYIWKFMAVFLSRLGIESIVRFAFVLQTLVITGGALLFYRRLFGPGRGWMLFLLLLVIPVSTAAFGRYGLNPYGYFHAGALGFGLALIAYALIDRGWWVAGGALCGGLFLIHPITAVYAAGFFFVRALFECVSTRSVPRPLIAGTLVLLGLAAPSFAAEFHSIAAPPGAAAIDPHLWRQLAKARMGHGYFISEWVADRFIQIGACFAVLFLLFRKHPAFRRVLPLLAVVAVGLAFAAVGDLFSVRLFLRLQLGRCSYFVFFALTAFCADAIVSRSAGSDRSSRIKWTAAALIVLAILGDAALSGQQLWARIALTTLLSLGATLAAVGLFRAPRHAYLFTSIALIVLTATAARAPGAMVWTHAQALRDPWIETAVWCRAAIPRDEVVMTPITNENFRPYAQRATYCSWKDGAPHCFRDSTLVIWWSRMQRFGVSLPLKRTDLPALYHAHALEVARAENIRYVVFDKEYARATGPLAFENSAFGVIDLRGWDSRYRLEQIR